MVSMIRENNLLSGQNSIETKTSGIHRLTPVHRLLGIRLDSVSGRLRPDTMNVARPARCLFCSFSRAVTTGAQTYRRPFHLSAVRFNNDKPQTPDNPEKPQLKTLKELTKNVKPEDFKPYSEEEKARLSEEYTEEQIAAIQAAEEAIDPKDLADEIALPR